MNTFIATPWAGYYWNTATKTLFSTKRKKIIELKRSKMRDYRRGIIEGYTIYHNKANRFVSLAELWKLTGTPVNIYATRQILDEELFID